MIMTFHSYANKTHFHKKGCALGLNLKMRVLGTQKWPAYSLIFDYYYSEISLYDDTLLTR